MFVGGQVAGRVLGFLGFARASPAETPRQVIAPRGRVPALPSAAEPPVGSPDRFRIDSSLGLEPVLNRLAAGARPATGSASTHGRSRIDSSSAAWRPGGRLPVDDHVSRLIDCLQRSSFQPGDVIEPARMRAIYEHMCGELGWRPHAWNRFACQLKFAMEPGSRGAPKTYVNILNADGTEKRGRGYIVPPRPARVSQDSNAPAQRDVPAIPSTLRRAA